jgi:hypothetical protein
MLIIPCITIQNGADFLLPNVAVDLDDDIAEDLIERGHAVAVELPAVATPKTGKGKPQPAT